MTLSIQKNKPTVNIINLQKITLNGNLIKNISKKMGWEGTGTQEDPIVINRIIEAMGEIKDAKATMAIVELLKKELEKQESEQDKSLLFLIVESLMKIGDKRALEHLGLLLEVCEGDIKNLTEKALECIDPNWKENLTRKSKI